MSSPLVGSAKVEITGDLTAFAERTETEIESMVSQWNATFEAGFTELTAQFGAAGTEAGGALGAGVEGAASEVAGSVPEAWGAIGDAAGGAMVTATTEAITSGAGAIGGAASGVADGAGAEARTALTTAGAEAGRGFARGAAASIETGGAAIAEAEASVAVAGRAEATASFRETGVVAGERFAEGAKEGSHALGGAIFGGVAVLGVGEVVDKAVEAADQLEGANIKIEHVFGKSADSVEHWAGSLANSFGISKAAGETLAGTYAGILAPLNKGSAATAGMSEKLVELAANIARARNADPASVETALAAGLRGRTTALRQYGVDISQTTLATYAYSHGLGQIAVDSGKVDAAQSGLSVAEKALTDLQKKGSSTAAERSKALADVELAQEKLTKATQGSKIPLSDAQKTQAAYNLILGQTKSSEGAVADSTQTLAQKKQILEAKVTNLEAALGAKLFPAMTAIANVMIVDVVPALGEVGHLIDENRGWLVPLVLALGAGVVAYKAVTIATGAYKSVMGGVRSVLGLFGVGQAEAATSTEATTVALGEQSVAAGEAAVADEGLAAAQGEVDAAMDANPIGLIIAAIAALVVGVIYAYDHFQVFRDIVKAVWDAVKDAISLSVDAIKLTIHELVVAAQAVWTAIKAVWDAVGKPIFDLIAAAIKFDVAVWKTAIDVFIDVVKAVWTAVKWAWDNIGKPAFDAARTGIRDAVNAIKTVVADIGHAFSDAYDAAKRYMGNLIGAVKALPGEIRAVVGDVVSAGLSLIQGLWHGIEQGASAVGNFVSNIVGAIKDGINSFLHLPIHIPKINTHIPGVGTIGGETLIPALATGGMTTGPTMALVGDNPSGRELVLPLDSPSTLNALSDVMSRSGSSSDAGAGLDPDVVRLLGEISDKLDAISHLPAIGAAAATALQEVNGLHSALTGAVG